MLVAIVSTKETPDVHDFVVESLAHVLLVAYCVAFYTFSLLVVERVHKVILHFLP